MKVFKKLKVYFNEVKFFLKSDIKISDRSSIFKYGKNCNCQSLEIKIKGKNNIFKVGENFKNKDFKLSITGDNNELVIGDNFHNRGECKIKIIGSNNKIIIGNNIRVVTQLKVYSNDKSQNCLISIGNNTSFYKTEIFNYENESSVIIGEDCMFSYDTFVYNTDGHSIFSDGKLINSAEVITIGNHVWIAWGVTILKNATIPDDCVIGRGAIVSEQFTEEKTIIAGIPAKVIKKNIQWDRKSVNEVKNG